MERLLIFCCSAVLIITSCESKVVDKRSVFNFGSIKRLHKRSSPNNEATLFNFMPELQRERELEDVTYNVLNLIDTGDGSGSGEFSDKSSDYDGFGLDARIGLAKAADANPLTHVDCSSASVPMKQIVQKKVRKWRFKYSQHCKQPNGQFRYPENCHAFVDCWYGRGTLKHCHPRTLVFNEATRQCDWPRNVQCINEDSNADIKHEIDLDLPFCSNYTALGYKCVNFWHCSPDNNIVDDMDNLHGEGYIDARMVPPQQTVAVSGQFDPLAKKCDGPYEVCCKGDCLQTATKKEKLHNEMESTESNVLCPGDMIGLRPIPGFCTKFAECYKGKAVVKDCPPGTHFCMHSLMCDWPTKVVCDQFHMSQLSSVVPATVNDDPHSIRSPNSMQFPSTSLPQLPELGFVARKLNIIPAPPSGQVIRLRHGKSPSEGYLQMFHDNRWGFVCDAGTWTLEEANVVCNQLGFKRGVRKTTQGLVYGSVEEEKKITELIDCNGSEDKLDECDLKYDFESGTSCKLAEDIVSISCLPDSWANCGKGEVPWKNSCYSFHANATTFQKAQEACKMNGGSLVEIDSQEENDILSELLFQNNRVTHIMDEVWTGGVGSNIARKNVWFWHSDTDKLMEFRNFWQGWSGGERSSVNIENNYSKGIKISRKFPFLKQQQGKNVDQFTDYYFWVLENFDSKLTYICEKSQIDIGCIEESGENYKGNAARTRFGDTCRSWDTPELSFWFDDEQISKLGDLENNNFCRNPDESEAPWCLTGTGEYELCDIPSCALPVPTESPFRSSCGADRFECSPGECIFSGYVCDGDFDCSNKADESPMAVCQSYSDQFKEVENVRLNVKEVERWTNRNIEACLRSCIMAKDFVCRSVNFDHTQDTCVLLEDNVGLSGMLEETFDWKYFEKIVTQVTCPENLMCHSGKCLKSSQFCDGKYDCPDKKDEHGCNSTPNVEVRLVDGKFPNEGRVEIKAYEYGWGGICDDGFTIQEANVICRAAGYSLGALEAVLHSRFGEGQEIHLDEFKCLGTEESVLECKSNPWKEHDCSAKEYAGVICRDESKECLEEEWRCSSGECINLDFLCDTTQDCSDGSDEELSRCKGDVQVKLTGGNNVTSGRVEIKYKGVWGTMCDDNFGIEEGRVICKMLGFPGGVKIYSDAAFGPGVGPIWIKDIMCNGNESKLEECPSPAWGPSYQCKHLEDVGLECLLKSMDDLVSPDIDVRSSISNAEECGVAEIVFKPSMPIAKVAHGQTAAAGSQPWTAGIRVRGATGKSFHWCGAVIIDDFHILTAAHCVEDYPKDTYLVRVGDWDQDIEDIREQEYNIQSVHFHPEFNVGTYLNNDIAVIKVKSGPGGSGIAFNDRVKPACLPPPTTSYTAGMECTISGWGSLGQGSGGYSRRLQAAKVPLLRTSECMQKHVYGPDKLSGGMFCAGFLEGGVDSCQGDSGGPMVCELRGKNTLLGIISWGYGCGRPNKPGVYTRVVNYLDWIQDVIGST